MNDNFDEEIIEEEGQIDRFGDILFTKEWEQTRIPDNKDVNKPIPCKEDSDVIVEEEKDEEPIYEMTLEIDGVTKVIKIYYDTDPEELAYDFCKSNNLDVNAMNYLYTEINNLVNKFKNKPEDKIPEIVEVEEENNISEKHITTPIKEHSENLHENLVNKFEEKEVNTDPINLLAREYNIIDHYGDKVYNDVEEIKYDNQYVYGKEEDREYYDNHTEDELEYDNQEENYKNQENDKYEYDDDNNPEYIEENNNLQEDRDEIYEYEYNENNNIDKDNLRSNIEEYINEDYDRDKLYDNQNKKYDYLEKYDNLTKHTNYRTTEYFNTETMSNPQSMELNFKNQSYENFKYILFPKTEPRLASYKSSKSKPSLFLNELFIERQYDKNRKNNKIINTTTSRSNVFERLYNNHKFKRYDKASTPVESPKKNISSRINYGEILYNKGIKMNEKKKFEAAFQRTEQMLDPNCYFSPRINDYEIENEGYNKIKRYNNYDYERDKLERIERLKHKYPEKEYPFKPDKYSNDLIQVNRNELHVDTRLNKIEEMRRNEKSKYSFKPIINKNYEINIPFEERQKIFREKSEDNRLRVAEENNPNYDFKPVINKAYGETRDVFEEMYNYKDKYKLSKESLRSKYETKPLKKRSDVKIIKKMKEEVFRKIFSELDSDKDNIISGFNININSLDKNMKEILYPIINEMKQDNESLTQLEFLRAMEKLYEILDLEEKRYILNYYKAKPIIKRKKESIINYTYNRSLIDEIRNLTFQNFKKSVY